MADQPLPEQAQPEYGNTECTAFQADAISRQAPASPTTTATEKLRRDTMSMVRPSQTSTAALDNVAIE